MIQELDSIKSLSSELKNASEIPIENIKLNYKLEKAKKDLEMGSSEEDMVEKPRKVIHKKYDINMQVEKKNCCCTII